MKTTYLDEYLKNKIVYLPIGTFEWHGNHLPLETDAITAEKVCEEVSKIIPGYVMEPLYIATDVAEGDLYGMQRHLKKQLAGEVYYLNQELFIQVVTAVTKNLLRDGFKKVVIVTGHAGSGQLTALEEIEKTENVVTVNPFKDIEIHVQHADEYETSLFWSCRPEEEVKSRAKDISLKDDYFRFLGRDPRKDASVEKGKRLLKQMIKTTINAVKG